MASKRAKFTSQSELKRFQAKYSSWKGSKKCSKYVELCLNLGACYDFTSEKNPDEEWNSNFDKALEIFEEGVEIAKEIKFKIVFERMIDYGELLYWREIHHENIDTRYKPLEWFSYCLETSKKLKVLQQSIFEAWLGLSMFLIQAYQPAYEFFIKGLDYKFANLHDEVKLEFLRKGAECMRILKKRKEYLKISELEHRFQDYINVPIVEKLIKRFDLDAQMYKRKKAQESPYFLEICHYLKSSANEDKVLNVFFSMVLIKNKMVSKLIPQLLDEYKSGSDYEYNFYHCYMDYHLENGDIDTAIDYCLKALKAEKFDYSEEVDFDGNMYFCQKPWCPTLKIARKAMNLRKFTTANWCYIAVLENLGNVGKAKDCKVKDYKSIAYDIMSECTYNLLWTDLGHGVKSQESVELIIDICKNNEFADKSKFDVPLRLAQCLRIQGKYSEASKAIMKSPNKKYAKFFSTICELIHDNEVIHWSVFEGFNCMSDVTNFLTREKDNFDLFPEDNLKFTELLPHFRPKNTLFHFQILQLHNSYRIGSLFKIEKTSIEDYD